MTSVIVKHEKYCFLNNVFCHVSRKCFPELGCQAISRLLARSDRECAYVPIVTEIKMLVCILKASCHLLCIMIDVRGKEYGSPGNSTVLFPTALANSTVSTTSPSRCICVSIHLDSPTVVLPAPSDSLSIVVSGWLRQTAVLLSIFRTVE